LPTQMFEGQPISVLEAYASGCAVITTGQPGIRDVFSDGINGFEVPAASSAAIARSLAKCVACIDRLQQIAAGNRRTAGERYRPATFTTSLTKILESVEAA
jgi:glycosyltransferase involved in cell wall biosynthesis